MIKCSNLIIGYNKPITQPLNLEIPTNAWVGIVGKNGVGKSTFFKTLLGKIPSISGSITINNAKVNINSISYIPQEREINFEEKTSGYTLVKYSYKPNSWGLPLFDKNFREKLEYLIMLTQTQDYIHKPFKNLSGGQKKRIYLVQALINNPKVLLLDEPLSDLDPDAKQRFLACLKAIHKKESITLLLISHDMKEISSQLDAFIHFKDGQCHYCNAMPCLQEDICV
ncbi:metal ABC transporter ATP-binding protein [Francisella philomiragia]|uniref:ATP-binding cassette domain-containing protein n=1 Tax=Francisella philomiragia TaxID=28110 RepID=A0ABS1GE30_9GAMM|nr:ATP-binding cassette domain-containing protein [Francisella philomiragia]MBK2259030.1 ATP-binding cassette domain-containing protein [Francisella philomiragia]MBK2296503.1 ATP-binding cassette domain-containing protein [Francisella philomiragia]MBK2302933.1 ATP-binding cassette domain-containing protein [Francisella philomiragia]MBK2340970.1 ATP-binding cassette domain-containing protein [Francisella philomiragia]